MELCEFAERILFATTLDAKLECPTLITDERPGLPVEPPPQPGRPAELQFRSRGSRRSDFPSQHRLEQARERGRLLHFFANHELLATELMALVLLRFPQAPPAFRRGVLQTLKDEQEHTRLYLRRMRECGVHFGELPVRGYFWRAIAGMQSPMDYVAGLSLTFEQANLDFARHFQRQFVTVGDPDTARLLDRIYQDEIGHVAYGLKWFRQWKNPMESDWDAYSRQLKFPLSPQRAKGIALNIEGRRAAGLDPGFIAELNVYAQSRGRTPTVFWFNPLAEGRIAQGNSFSPVKHQAALVRDLENLPQFLCRRDDLVVVDQRPAVDFLSGLKQAGFELPEFFELKGAPVVPAAQLGPRKLGGLRPWAWGPDSVELLAPLFENLTGDRTSPESCFNPGIARLYSKGWSAGLLRRLLRERGQVEVPELPLPATAGVSAAENESWLCSDEEVGIVVENLPAALETIASLRRLGHAKLVVKETIGLAGHNAIRLWEPELLETQRRWLIHNFEHGRQLVIEPWLERELDFSVHWEMSDTGLKFRGYVGLLNDRKGQYQGNWVAPNCDRRPPAGILSLFRAQLDLPHRLPQLYTAIAALLEPELRTAGYRGPIGMDAFVYRTSTGAVRLKPIVEINPRYTMGRLTLELMKQICPGSCALFRLVNRPIAQAEGFDSFPAFARFLSEHHPVRLEGEPTHRIREGSLCLNNPSRAQVCLAIWQVSRTLDSLLKKG